MSYKTDLQSFAAQLRGFMGASTTGQAALDSRTVEEFSRMALELFALQFRQNPAYRKICEARHRTPATVEHWSKIPAVPTAAFKESELSCLAEGDRTAVFFSSGTTESRPSRHFHNRDSLSLYEESALTWFRCAGPLGASSKIGLPTRGNQEFSTSLRLLCLTPDKISVPHSSLVHMFEAFGRSGQFSGSEFLGTIAPDGSWELNVAAAHVRLQKILVEGEPVMIVGTAFSFVHLLDYLVERKLVLALPPASRVLETGGYKGRSRSLPKSELHSLISARLGVRPGNIVCEYGMAELSSQAYDALPVSSRAASGDQPGPQNVLRPFHFAPWARAQIVSPDTGCEVAEGQQGLIRLFDLANVYSVMSIQTEDLAIRRGEVFELVGRANQAEPRGCSLMALAS